MNNKNNKEKIQIFRLFLEEKTLCAKIIKFKKINKGGSSYNFLCQTEKFSYLVKLIVKEDMNRAQRLCSILATFNEKADFYTSHIIEVNNKPYFECGNYIGILMNYVKGRHINAFELSPYLLDKISDNYKKFQALSFQDKSFILPVRTAKQLYRDNLRRIKELQAEPITCLQQKLLNGLLEANENIYQKTSSPQMAQTIIHGDASLNNMILNKNGDIAFLDFEFMRNGFVIEDICELVLSALLPHFVFLTPTNKLRTLFKHINSQHCFSKQEWIYGINMYFLYLLFRRIYGRKLLTSIRRDWLFWQRLKKHQSIINIIEGMY